MLLSSLDAILLSNQKRVQKDCVIHDIQNDSRSIKPGDVFVAITGTEQDGHHFITQALQNGAIGVVVSDQYDVTLLPDTISYWCVSSTPQAWSLLAQAWFDNPAQSLKMIAITGTSGKTTCAHILYKMLQSLGQKAVLIGTGGIYINNQEMNYTMKGAVTTPDPKELHYILSQGVKEKCQYAVLEASSHGLSQERLFGILFDAVVLTSLSPCHHIGYHKTLSAYIQAKEKIFHMTNKNAITVVNKDAELFDQMQLPPSSMLVTISHQQGADYLVYREPQSAVNNENRFRLQDQQNSYLFLTMLHGDFQMFNLSAAFLIGRHFDFPTSSLQRALQSIDHIPGRWHKIDTTLPLTIIVDKANVLIALKHIKHEIESMDFSACITVFGNVGGGEKDARAELGQMICSFSDKVILTLDDPETEEPSNGFRHFMSALSCTDAKKVIILENRENAIEYAIENARENSLVAILGRGNQKEFLVQGRVEAFDDIATAQYIVANKEKYV
jgi:UDP-N-acetylmuramoyl-L-alanyl-D-glutamate--2,6-diaminopimelate ligase